MPVSDTLLPLNSTKLERALEQVAKRLIDDIDVDALRRMRDPYLTSSSHLPFLAWGRGVDLWRSNWPEWKKRRITAEIYGMKGLKGTLPGINKYLSYVDAEVYEAIIPPVGVFAVGQTKESLDAWRSQFAELRLYPFSIPGERPVFSAGHDTRLGPSFAGASFALENESVRYYGRRATIVDNGVETEIRSFEQIGTWGSDRAINVTTFAIPTDGTLADTIAGYAYVGHTYVPAKARGRIITVGHDGAAGYGDLPSGIESVETLNVAPERVHEQHGARAGSAYATSAGMFGANTAFAYENQAPRFIYDRWRLLDPDRVRMTSSGLFAPFVGRSFVALTPYTAMLRVKATYQREGWWSYAGHAYAGKTHAGEATDRVRDVGEAIYKSRALRDQIWFTTATWRPMNLDDLSFQQGVPWSGMVPLERTAL